jgi:hypothetical protein
VQGDASLDATQPSAILAAATVLFPVGEQRLLVRLSSVRWPAMPAYKREATEDSSSNHEERSDERDALDEHNGGSLAARVL